MPLARYLTTIFLPLTLLLFLLSGLSGYYFNLRTIIDKTEEELNIIADLRSKEIDRYLSSTQQQLKTFNSRLLIREILQKHPNNRIPLSSREKLQKVVLETRAQTPAFSNIHLIAENGEIAASTDLSAIGARYQHAALLPSIEQPISLANIIVDSSGERVLLHLMKLTLDGLPAGYLVFYKKLANITELVNSKLGLGESGKLYLLVGNEDGSYQYLIKPSNLAARQDETLTLQDQKLSSGNIVEWIDYRGVEVMGGYRDIELANWKMVVKLDRDEVMAIPDALLWIGSLELLAAIVVSILVISMVSSRIAKPISQFAKTATELPNSSAASSFTGKGINEFVQLAAALNKMAAINAEKTATLEQRVLDRTRELSMRNQTLSQTIKELKHTQELLVETEKMAALAELLAGVAHEVNTPLGAALIASTHLQSSNAQTKASYLGQSLTEQAFEQQIQDSETSLNIIVSNLKRAGELIRSFKRVAADQNTDAIESFDLVAYTKDVLTSLQPNFKHKNLEFKFAGYEAFTVKTLPRAIAQIVSNLVMNAVNHGFENRDAGVVSFVISKADNDFCSLQIADNGVGMDEATKDKVFNPFFTSKRGNGGTGLGLSIVHRLVSKTLAGSIQVESSKGCGTTFTILFPAESPLLVNG